MGFFFVASVAAAVVLVPFLVAGRSLLPEVGLTGWTLLVATGLAQGLYVFGLAGAYGAGDISLAYPLARALPVLSVAAIGVALGRGDQIEPMGAVGMVLITIGCVVLPLPFFRRLTLNDYRSPVYRMALVASAGTTGYTLIDDAALSRLRELIASDVSQTRVTIFYVSLQAIATALGIGLFTVARSAGRRQLQAVVGDRSLVGTALLTGVVITITYGLALAALAYVRDVSYVAAFRQLSIPIGAALGLTLQGEPLYRPKLVGIGVVTVGLILVGLG